jgi:hypothetical protein
LHRSVCLRYLPCVCPSCPSGWRCLLRLLLLLLLLLWLLLLLLLLLLCAPFSPLP